MIRHGSFQPPSGGGFFNVTVGHEPSGGIFFWRPPNNTSTSGFGIGAFDGSRQFTTGTASTTSSFRRSSSDAFTSVAENPSGTVRVILTGDSILSTGFRLQAFTNNTDNYSYVSFPKSVKFYVDQFSISSTGTINRTGVGFEPKLALFFWRHSILSTTSSFYMGAADGTSQFTTGYNQTSSNRDRHSSSSECIAIRGTTGGVVTSASFNGFLGNGYSLNVATATSTQPVSVILIGDGDAEVLAKIGDLPIASTDTTFDVDDVGFRPDGVMGIQFMGTSTTQGARHGFGFASRVSQSSVRWAQTSGDASRVSDTSNTFVARTSNNVNEVLAPITSFDPNGFSGTVTTSVNRDFKFIALKVNAVAEVEPIYIDFSVPEVQATSGGTARVESVSIDFSIPEFKPQWVWPNTAEVEPLHLSFTVPTPEVNTAVAEPLTDTLTIQTVRDSLSIRTVGDSMSIQSASDSISIQSSSDSLVIVG